MIPIAFDVLGTCYSLDAATEAIQAAFGDQLREKGVGATQIVDDWFHVSQRDFSVSGWLPRRVDSLLRGESTDYFGHFGCFRSTSP